MFKIEDSTQNSVVVDFLTQKINQETPQFGSAYPFSFCVRDAKEEIIAGCNGSIVYGVIYTDQIWVHPAHRQAGFGRKLMDHVHEYGRLQKCTMATVMTMDFQQAQHFYERLGYVVEFERVGYFSNSKCIFLVKRL